MNTKSIRTKYFLKKLYLKKLNIIQREMSHRIDVESISIQQFQYQFDVIRHLIDDHFLLGNYLQFIYNLFIKNRLYVS